MDHWLQIQFLIERFSTKRSIIRTSFPGWIDWSGDPDSYREGKRKIWFLVCPCMNFM